jgi:hypothetical protein
MASIFIITESARGFNKDYRYAISSSVKDRKLLTGVKFKHASYNSTYVRDMAGEASMNKWEFKKDVTCFFCKKNATQLIEIFPVETIVTCTNCGAERHYTIHGTLLSGHKDLFTGTKRKYDLWEFVKFDKCGYCGDKGENRVLVDEYKVGIICPSCTQTRIYNFNFLKPGVIGK